MWRRSTARLWAQNSPPPNVEAEPPGQLGGVGHPDRRQQVVIARAEPIRIVLVVRVEPDAEQQTERVGPVVERREVVALHRPHVLVAVLGMQAVAVRRLLRVEHRGLHVGDRQARAAPASAQLRLEQEPAVNVDDGLCRADELHVEQ